MKKITLLFALLCTTLAQSVMGQGTVPPYPVGDKYFVVKGTKITQPTDIKENTKYILYCNGDVQCYATFRTNGSTMLKAENIENKNTADAFNALVEFEKVGETGKWLIKSVQSGTYLNGIANNNDAISANQNKDNAGQYSIQIGQDANTLEMFMTNNGNNMYINGKPAGWHCVSWDSRGGNSGYSIYEAEAKVGDYECKVVYKLTVNGKEQQTLQGESVLGITPELTNHNNNTLPFATGELTRTESAWQDKVKTVTYTGSVTYPFDFATSSNGQLATEAPFYAFNILRDGHDGNKAKTVCYDNTNGETFSKTKFGLGSLWTIVKANDKVGQFKIYNLLADKYLTIPTNDKAKATYTDFASASTFNVLACGNAQAFMLQHSDKNSIVLGDHNGDKLSTWDGGNTHTDDGGNFFKVLAVTADDVKNSIVEKPNVNFNAVGGYTAEQLQQIKDLKATLDGSFDITNMKTFITQAQTTLPSLTLPAFPALDPNKYYRFIFANREDNAFTTGQKVKTDANGAFTFTQYDDANLEITRMIRDDADYSSIWQVVAGENQNEYKLKNVNTGHFMGRAQKGQDQPGIFLAEEGQTWKLVDLQHLGLGLVEFKQDDLAINAWYGNNAPVPCALSIGNPNDDGSYLYVEEVTQVPVTLSAGYASIVLPFEVTLPEGLTAYYAKTALQAGATEITLTAMNGNVLPANTPVILSGTDNQTYQLTISSTNAQQITDNQFKGFTMKRTGNVDGVYALRKSDGKLAKVGTGVQEFPANRIYLEASASAAALLSFVFDDECTTGIEGVEAESAKPYTGKYYDMRGVPTYFPTRGIYTTEDGRKVLFP